MWFVNPTITLLPALQVQLLFFALLLYLFLGTSNLSLYPKDVCQWIRSGTMTRLDWILGKWLSFSFKRQLFPNDRSKQRPNQKKVRQRLIHSVANCASCINTHTKQEYSHHGSIDPYCFQASRCFGGCRPKHAARSAPNRGSKC